MKLNDARSLASGLAIATLAGLVAIPVGASAAGTVRAPADDAGRFEYRLLVASPSGAPVVTSAPTALTVTGPSGAAPATPASTTAAGASSCTACTVANNALPWLALIVDPSTVWDAITAVVSTLGVIIASFFGF
jgi:hypothetical protein